MYKLRNTLENTKKNLKKVFDRKKKRGRPRKKTAYHSLGNALIILGVLVIILPLVFQTYTKFSGSIKKNSTKKTAINTVIQGKKDNSPIKIDSALLATKELSLPPERIIIPSQKINLPIMEAQVVDGFWEISETTASHGVGSAYPGDIGNMVIFAHAREGLFLPLKDVQKDDDIFVLSKDHWYRYQVKEIKDVNPDQLEVIAPTKDETLTLYTCSGFLDSKRRIVVGKRLF